MICLKLEKVKEILKNYGQDHILASYERLPQEGKERLLDQVLAIDFKQIQDLYKQTKEKPDFSQDKFESIPFVDGEKLSPEEKERYIQKGEELIKTGKYAVSMVAGGQGTRLGHHGPKGTFDIGLPSHKSLFEIFTDKLKEAKAKYGVTIPWYIMTSRENNQDTIDFFEEHDYFGYREGVKGFFIQNELPMIDQNGRVILGENGLIKEAANGHGGIFDAMIKNNVLKELQEQGVEWIFTCAVDNPLVQMVDPLLLGYAAENHFMAASKSIVKAGPKERVGILCKRNGNPGVIEYTEISDEMAEAVDESGEYLYGESHIMINLFHINTIEGIAKEELPYHSAFKKCDYLSESGEMVEATQPNAYKFETFIFDAFGRLENMGVLRGKREENFAPVKNAEGVDSPETARKLYMDYYHLS